MLLLFLTIIVVGCLIGYFLDGFDGLWLVPAAGVGFLDVFAIALNL